MKKCYNYILNILSSGSSALYVSTEGLRLVVKEHGCELNMSGFSENVHINNIMDQSALGPRVLPHWTEFLAKDISWFEL